MQQRRFRKPKIFTPKVFWGPDLYKWVLQVPFHTEVLSDPEKGGEAFRNELKLMCNIPPKFDRDISAWLIDEQDEAIVKQILNTYFPTMGYTWEDKPKNGHGFSNYDPTQDDSAFRKLFLLAGRDNANKLWRATLQLYHPDTPQGDTQKAQEVNVAWTEIKRQLGW